MMFLNLNAIGMLEICSLKNKQELATSTNLKPLSYSLFLDLIPLFTHYSFLTSEHL